MRPKVAKIMMKCTVKKSSKKGSKRHLEIQKVPQNKQIRVREKSKKGSKMDLKNGTEKSSLKSTRNRPKIGVQSKYYKRPPLQKPVHRKHALKTLGRWFTHPHFKLHACQHLKSRKVKKHVKWDPTKGPLGAKSAKKEPKTAIGMKEE
jgi:hypothetical protein